MTWTAEGTLRGAAGPAPTITVDSVTTLTEGLPATAVITGTSPDLHLALGIPRGARGADGTGVSILGGYDTEEDLRLAHPSGTAGDAYLVGGRLYVWTGADWSNVGTIQGPKGDPGDSIKGDDGAPGPRGPGWFTGAGTPGAIPDLVPGDLYLDSVTGAYYRWTP